MKANNHPLVRDLRRLLDRHGLQGAVLLGITTTGHQVAASAGSDVRKCDALGAVLQDSDHVSMLHYDIDVALMDLES